MKLYVRLEAPFEWVRVQGNRVESFGEVPSPADFPVSEDDELIGVVPGQWVTAHTVNLPAKSKRQFQTAVPFALEDAVSEDVELLHFSCSNWKAGEPTVVHVVAKSKMHYWQQLANDCKLPLDTLVPDYSLLPLHDVAECTVALAHSSSDQHFELVANQKNGTGACVDRDFLDVWLKDLPLTTTIAVTDQELVESLIKQYTDRDFRLWEAGNKLAHWLEYPQENNIDLFSEEYRPSVRHFNWRDFAIPAMLVAAAVLLVFAFDTYRYLALHAEIKEITRQQKAVVTEYFPELADMPDQDYQALMERALMSRSSGGQQVTVMTLLATAARILKQQNATMKEISFRDGKLQIVCALKDLSQVDQIMTQLNSSAKISAQLESSATDEGQILATYIMRAT